MILNTSDTIRLLGHVYSIFSEICPNYLTLDSLNPIGKKTGKCFCVGPATF